MSVVSDVFYTLRCDYPGCHGELGPDMSLASLRADAVTEDGWVADGPDDLCRDHADAEPMYRSLAADG